ncbi:MAG: efflux RND transporter periplasmic adaptor subunit [Alphaproteobacteria bacterium]|nr:efflux RND transporter periplasmic adaptor subunit [Alphaproteobacteria bacterium]
MPTRRSLVLRVALTALLLAALFAGLWGFKTFRDKAMGEYFASAKPPPTPVSVAEAKVESVPKYLTAIGTVVAARQVVVSPEVAGRVSRIFFESGARATEGEPLVQLSDATEQADLLALRAQARLAEINLNRARDLLRSQAGPRTTVDQNIAQLDEINARIQRTQSLIAYKLIRAPFEGDLGIRAVDLGQFVDAGAPVVTLTDLSRLHVDFTLPENTLGRLRIGQAVVIESDSAPGRGFDAQLTTIEPQVSAETRAIRARATLDNPERLLLPGMFANVRVVLPPAPERIVVPETAVDYTVYGDSVFVVREQGEAMTVERVPVTAGDRFQGRVEILKGLAPGDRVVSSGQLKLNNGAAVTLAQGDALAPPATLPSN